MDTMNFDDFSTSRRCNRAGPARFAPRQGG